MADDERAYERDREAALMPTWQVQAWVMAPGEFPSYSREQEIVPAKDAAGAIVEAVARFERTGLSPVVVSVLRVNPPPHHAP